MLSILWCARWVQLRCPLNDMNANMHAHACLHMCRLLCAAVDVHRDQDIDTPYTTAAVAILGRFLPSLRQASMHGDAVTALWLAHCLAYGPLGTHVHVNTTVEDGTLDGFETLKACWIDLQSCLTFQWDLWNDRSLPSLAHAEFASCRFLLTAAAALISSDARHLRQAWVLCSLDQ